VVAELVEVKLLPSLAFFCGRFDASMLRQAQRPQAQWPNTPGGWVYRSPPAYIAGEFKVIGGNQLADDKAKNRASPVGLFYDWIVYVHYVAYALLYAVIVQNNLQTSITFVDLCNNPLKIPFFYKLLWNR